MILYVCFDVCIVYVHKSGENLLEDPQAMDYALYTLRCSIYREA